MYKLVAVLFWSMFGFLSLACSGSQTVDEVSLRDAQPIAVAGPRFQVGRPTFGRFPNWKVEHVRVDEGCSTLVDYCVRAFCSVRNASGVTQSGTVAVFAGYGRDPYKFRRDRKLTLTGGEVAYLEEEFREARSLGTMKITANCLVATATQVACPVENVGSQPGTARLKITAAYSTGETRAAIRELELDEGAADMVYAVFPDDLADGWLDSGTPFQGASCAPAPEAM